MDKVRSHRMDLSANQKMICKIPTFLNLSLSKLGQGGKAFRTSLDSKSLQIGVKIPHHSFLGSELKSTRKKIQIFLFPKFHVSVVKISVLKEEKGKFCFYLMCSFSMCHNF